jgi:transporter family protein
MAVILLLIITVLLWGTSPILEKVGLGKIDPLSAVTIRSLAVAVMLIVFVLATGRSKEILEADAKTIAIFTLSGLMAGLLGMWTYFGALKLWPASKVVPIAATYPLVTALLSVIILREGVTIFRLLGIILIIAGIWLVKQ